MTASWQGLAGIPHLLDEVKMGVKAVQALLSTPAAAQASGSPLAAAAMIGLGIEIVVFIEKTVEAVEHDIATIEKITQNYKMTDADVTAAASAIGTVVSQLITADRPALNAGVQTRRPKGSSDRVGPLVSTGASK